MSNLTPPPAAATNPALRAGVLALAAAAAALALGAGALRPAQPAVEEAAADPAEPSQSELVSPASLDVGDVLALADEDVRRYNDHITILASPWMAGRVPGSDGAERARVYAEDHFRQFGLKPAFPLRENGSETPFATYRDPFSLGGSWEVERESLALVSPKGTTKLEPGTDFVLTGLGTDGAVIGEAVFVGYSIQDGHEGFNSYADSDDLTGKVAVMFRFEPMDEQGNSKWTGGEWTEHSSFDGKLNAAARRGAKAIVVLNPPGSADARAKQLQRFSGGGGGGGGLDIPVVMVSIDAAEELVASLDGQSRSLMDLRRLADAGPIVEPLKGLISIDASAKIEKVQAENVGGVIPGVGDLADEYIVIGGHIDHLGMGYFGSRAAPGTLHPGADDNASGAAGVILIAEKLAATVAAMPADQPRRSILLVCFDAEESGLNGSRHYVNDPIAPADKHVFMVNWDMIGRIQNDRVEMAGVDTAAGFRDWVKPYADASGLVVNMPSAMSGASDHTSFYQAGIPVAFSIISDFHGDYHTPEDVSWKINRTGATKVVRLYHDIVRDMATRPERFAFQTLGGGGMASGSMSGIKVRFGIMPGSYDEDLVGIPVAQVTPGGSAAEAGLQEGDVLVRWDGIKIGSVEDWMDMLGKHEPGDVVNVGVKRGGEEITLSATLKARR